MKNLGAKVTNYMDQAINKLETVLEQVDKGIGRTVSALDLVEQDISTTVKKDLRTFRKGIKLFARLLNVVFTATFLLVLYLKFAQPDIYADLSVSLPVKQANRDKASTVTASKHLNARGDVPAGVQAQNKGVTAI